LSTPLTLILWNASVLENGDTETAVSFSKSDFTGTTADWRNPRWSEKRSMSALPWIHPLNLLDALLFIVNAMLEELIFRTAARTS